MKTELNSRTLWYDGTNQVSPDIVPDLLLHGVSPTRIVVTEKDDDMLRYDACAEVPIATVKSENSLLDYAWRIPEEVKNIDLHALFDEILNEKALSGVYSQRVAAELAEVKKRSLENLFRTLYFVIGRFKEKKIVWGVGRGSACSSLLLFLLGVHCVDPVKFDIPYQEFFHD